MLSNHVNLSKLKFNQIEELSGSAFKTLAEHNAQMHMEQGGSHNALKFSCFEISYQEYLFVSEMFNIP